MAAIGCIFNLPKHEETMVVGGCRSLYFLCRACVNLTGRWMKLHMQSTYV